MRLSGRVAYADKGTSTHVFAFSPKDPGCARRDMLKFIRRHSPHVGDVQLKVTSRYGECEVEVYDGPGYVTKKTYNLCNERGLEAFFDTVESACQQSGSVVPSEEA